MSVILGSIGRKIILVVSSIVTTSLIVMMFLNIQQQERSTLSQNEQDMAKITESVSQALQTLMLAGYADIAQDFGRRLAEIPEIDSFFILRTDGREAFHDNKTIFRVNEVVGEEEFIPREEESENIVLPPSFPELVKAVQTRKQVRYYNTSSDGERELSFLLPIRNLEDCQECHGDDHEVRGVIYLTSSLTKVYEDIRKTQINSLVLLCITIVFIVVVTGIMIRRTIIRPVQTVTDAMAYASEGDLSRQVPILGRDEIGTMAASFNRMIEKLMFSREGMQREQRKLSTIILSTREGVIATNSEDEVVLVNPAAERLLGKSQEQIAASGLKQLVDDPAFIENCLRSHAPSELEWRGNVISVYASIIYDEEGNKVGGAVLLREITAEKKLENELRTLSITDELTGLFNRRYLDTILAEEISRSTRYHVPMSVLFFDIDHFKKFNDQHGHDQGDRVLEAVAATCKRTFRDTDKCCRYGGEEFLVILSNTQLPLSMMAAERLRKEIEKMRVDGLQVTISIGVADFPFLEPVSMEEFVSSADKALYEAKDNGRNCVVAAKT